MSVRKLYYGGSGNWTELPFARTQHIRGNGTRFDKLYVVTSPEFLDDFDGNTEFKYEDENGNPIFGGYAKSKGKVENGELKFFIDGYGVELSEQDTSIHLSSTDNTVIATEPFSGSDYTTTVNTGSVGTFAVAQYDNEQDAGITFRQMQDYYQYQIYPESYTPDSSPKATFLYEPFGNQNFVDDSSNDVVLDTSEDTFIKDWDKNVKSTVINSVEVKNSVSGVKYSATYDEVADGGAGSYTWGRKRFTRAYPQYITADSEAQDIAQRIVEAKKSPKSGGKVVVQPSLLEKTGVQSAINKKIGLVDNTRNINGEFTVVKQVDYYPERKTELWLGLEEMGYKRESRKALELSSEQTKTQVAAGGSSTLIEQDIGSSADTERIVYGQAESFESSSNSIIPSVLAVNFQGTYSDGDGDLYIELTQEDYQLLLVEYTFTPFYLNGSADYDGALNTRRIGYGFRFYDDNPNNGGSVITITLDDGSTQSKFGTGSIQGRFLNEDGSNNDSANEKMANGKMVTTVDIFDYVDLSSVFIVPYFVTGGANANIDYSSSNVSDIGMSNAFFEIKAYGEHTHDTNFEV